MWNSNILVTKSNKNIRFFYDFLNKDIDRMDLEVNK